MKASQLVSKLNKLIETHGDLTLILQADAEGNSYENISGADVLFLEDLQTTVDSEHEAEEYDEDVVGVVQERFFGEDRGSYFEGVILAPAIINEKVRHGTKLYSEDYVLALKSIIEDLEQRIDEMWMEDRVRGEWDE